MKTTLNLVAAISGAVIYVSQPQLVQGADANLAGVAESTVENGGAKAEFLVKSRDPHSTVWEKVTYEPNPWGGEPLSHRQVVTELGAGLNYQTASGNWLPTRELVEAAEGGAAAVQGRTKVRWANSLGSEWPIQIETPEGKTIRSRVLGVTCSDDTGKSVWLAEVKDSQGFITKENEVTYPDSMLGIKASIRFTYTRAGLEQDLLIEESLAGLRPEDLGLNPSTAVIALVTEFEPQTAPIVSRMISAESRPDVLSDEAVDFGALALGEGKAWLTGGSEGPKTVRVYKQWTDDGGRRFLLEKIAFPEVEEILNALPKYEGAAVNSERKKIQRLVSNKQSFPEFRKTASSKSGRMQIAANLKDPVLVASLQPRKALLADYQLFNQAAYTNYTFTGEMTYYISSPIEFRGATRLEGGAVIKIGTASNAGIKATNVICDTRSYSPCVITAIDDNTCGEAISGSTGNATTKYYGGIALDLTGSLPGSVLSNIRFVHLANAVAGAGVVLRDCQVIRCNNAFSSSSTSPLLENVLLYQLGKVLPNTQAANISAVHVTAHNVTGFLNNLTGTINLTNCLFAGVGSWQCANSNIANSVALTSDTGLFQTMGSGLHYLSDGSPYRDVGTSELSESLAKSLALKTTYPPMAFADASLTVDAVLGPIVERDGNTKDLGYHYDPLDYVFGGSHAYANITFAPGTAVGWYRRSSGWSHAGHGIHVGDQKILRFDGQAQAPCFWVRTTTVQEGYSGTWAGGYGPGGITGWAWPDVNNAPQLRARFLRASMLAGDGNHWRDDNGRLMVHMSDSEFFSGGMGGYVASFYLTNCLFQRTYFGLSGGNTGVGIALRSTTFIGERFQISRSTAVPVSVRDCAFDRTVFSAADSYAYNTSVTDYDYNAFVAGQSRLTNSGPNLITVTDGFGWQQGTIGRFYLPSTSPLVDTGSITSASTARMYHYTTQVDQTKEADSRLDIGYHYLATDLEGNPFDSDGDGLADYQEDANGNSLVDSGETDWQSSSDNGLKVIITRPRGGLIP